jgi:hypothetical protein
MMDEAERVQALKRMSEAIRRFYGDAVQIGNHPFIEFAGVMTAYLNSCRAAHEAGIDFTECNVHGGKELPMEQFEVAYLSEKLGCIFTGRVTATEDSRVIWQGKSERGSTAESTKHQGSGQQEGALQRAGGLQEGEPRHQATELRDEVGSLVVRSGSGALNESGRRRA